LNDRSTHFLGHRGCWHPHHALRHPRRSQQGAAHRSALAVSFLQRDSVLFTNRPRLLAQVAANRLPAIYGAREFTENGGLMSYGPDLADMYRRAAYLIDQILRGAKPSELPVEQATKFELVINLKTAKALGITIPQTLLQRADQVIQ
jgi:putative ABC transport system substrate-binding protein